MEPNVLIKLNALDNTKAAFASLKTNLGGLEKTVTSAKKDIEALEPAFRKMALVGTAAFAGIVGISGKAIQAYAEVERSQRQLEHAVVAVSKGTKEQVGQINELTTALEKKAGVDADSLNMGVAQLSTFGLSTDAVMGLTKSLADLTVNQSGLNATSDDYIQSANNIAKALNGQFGILEKSGIRFTEAQKNLIQFGTETEKVSALSEGFAQNLRETTDTVAGVDLASAKMKRTLENITENLGKALVPAFAQLAETVQPIIEKFANWAEQNPELLGNIILIGGAIAGVVAVLGTLGLILPPVIAGFGLLAGVILGISAPIAIVLIALAAIGAAIYYVWSRWDEHVSNMKWAFDGFKDGVVAAVDFMRGVVNGFTDWFGGRVDYIIKRVKDALAALASLPGVKQSISITKKAFSTVSDLFRADGGPVTGGQPYIVGERGPELFVPTGNGQIVSNEALRPSVAAASIGGGATNIYLTISNNSFMGERDMAERVGDQIIRLVKQNTRL